MEPIRKENFFQFNLENLSCLSSGNYECQLTYNNLTERKPKDQIVIGEKSFEFKKGTSFCDKSFASVKTNFENFKSFIIVHLVLFFSYF